jgi:hypothetical protein
MGCLRLRVTCHSRADMNLLSVRRSQTGIPKWQWKGMQRRFRRHCHAMGMFLASPERLAPAARPPGRGGALGVLGLGG